MAGTGREFARAHRPQHPAQRRLGDRDAVVLHQDLGQVDQPPAHDALDGRHRPLLDQGTQRLPLLGVQAWARADGLPVDQPIGAVGVEGQDPVTHGLQPDPAERGCLRARAPRVDRRQRQQTAGLRRIARRSGQAAQSLGVEGRPKRNGSSQSSLLRLQNPRTES
jgi:hypothetical protein